MKNHFKIGDSFCKIESTKVFHLDILAFLLSAFCSRIFFQSSTVFLASHNIFLNFEERRKISTLGNIEGEGQFTDFFSYTFLEITKKSHTKSQNHKKNHIQKAPKITNH